MKGGLILTGLVGTGFASMAKMEQMTKRLAGRMGFRNIQTQNAVIDNNLNFYGCWCYFEENPNGAVERTGIGYGKSEPVNEYDAACKILHGGYECVVADQAALGQSCEPWTVNYNVPDSAALDAQGSITACNAINTPNSCAAQACYVERQFVMDYLDLVSQSVPMQKNIYLHSNGFDQAGAGCPITKGTRNPTTACCGDYPQRYPYKTLSGARACCNKNGVGITFMIAAWQCCNDGVGPNGCPND
jgi:hypothetical protein